jgi:AraC-like DNA-binding protein
MPFIALLTRDPLTDPSTWSVLRHDHVVARTASWSRLVWLVRERPVTGVVLDSAALPPGWDQEAAVIDLFRQFPSVASVFVARSGVDRQTLFRLGRAGLSSLVLLPLEALACDLGRSTRRAFSASTDALVTRAISPYLPGRETEVVRMALVGAQLGWGTEDLANRSGMSRAHLSVRLKTRGLPSAGHLLIWAKLLHAGRWLSDPGRSAESVSRQLEYSSGAAFRRVLRNYVECTPTELRDAGGLAPVLSRFLAACGIDVRSGAGRSVA